MNSKPGFAILRQSFRSLAAAALTFGALSTSSQVQAADIWTLTDGTTSANLDVASHRMMYDWFIGGVDQLEMQTLFFRVGSGPQYSFDAASSRSVTQGSANTLNGVYNYGNFDVVVDYSLYDWGTGAADIQETITIRNNTASEIQGFNLYQYSDFNLTGIPGGDKVTVESFSAVQEKGLTGIAEGIIDPEAVRFEANVTGGTGSTLYKLMNQSDLDLNNNSVSEGDVTWSFQWNFNIAAGSEVVVLKDKYVWGAPIPEPSSFTLVALCLGLGGLARRRFSR